VFFEKIWNLWNWTDISARFQGAQRLELKVA
jgi:hypothetical protein